MNVSFKIAKQEKAAFFFLLPSLLLLLLFVFWPIIHSLVLSFQDWNLLDDEHAFIGMQNYEQMWQDSRFWNSVLQTALFTLGVVPIGIMFSLGFALLCNESLKGLSFFRTVYFLPVVTAFSIIGIVWTFILNPDIGIISYLLNFLHIPMVDWLHSTTWALPAVIMVAIWKSFGFNLIILLAGLQGIPKSLYESAQLDGATAFRRLFSVTLPMLRHTMLFVVIVSVINSFQVFDLIYVMTEGGPLYSTETIVYYIYHQGFQLLNMGYGSAMAWLLFVFVFIITIIQLRWFRYNEND